MNSNSPTVTILYQDEHRLLLGTERGEIIDCTLSDKGLGTVDIPGEAPSRFANRVTIGLHQPLELSAMEPPKLFDIPSTQYIDLSFNPYPLFKAGIINIVLFLAYSPILNQWFKGGIYNVGPQKITPEPNFKSPKPYPGRD